MTSALERLGFAAFFSDRFDALDRPDLVPARIASESRGAYRLVGCRAERGELRGRLRGELSSTGRPAVGDWVAVRDSDDTAMIEDILERRTALIRRAAGGRSAVQLVAANIDIVFIVTATTRDYNPRRIERYLVAVWDGGANPVIILNKCDLGDNIDDILDELDNVAPAVRVIRASAVTREGIDQIRELIKPGVTVGLVGSSGVGKSTIVNCLLDDAAQETASTRADEKGRHTTTRRDLIEIPRGGLVIDTPGMREFGLAEDGGGVDRLFEDIVEIADGCRFRDCRHEGEPGCAVIAAVESGELDEERLVSYHKLQRETAAAERRKDPVQANNAKRRWKAIHKDIRRHFKQNPGKKR